MNPTVTLFSNRDRSAWSGDWSGVVVPLGEIVLILGAAWLAMRVLRGVLQRLCSRYEFAAELAIGARRVITTLVYAAAVLLSLQRMGVSGDLLWTALTGFTAVAAVAFFAAWSVLSNIFCTLLILMTRPFRLHDHIELVESGDKPGLKGRVIDINFIFTTLQEHGADGSDTVLHIPNSQFFQRTTRRWRGEATG